MRVRACVRARTRVCVCVCVWHMSMRRDFMTIVWPVAKCSVF